MRGGIWFYGLATIITGILDLVWGAFEASHQPIKAMGRHIPGEHVLAYIAGAWLVAAGLAILSRRNARMGAAGSAIIYLIFAFFWIPRFYVMTHMFGFGIGVVVFVLGESVHRYSWPRQQRSSTPPLPHQVHGESAQRLPAVGC